MVAMAEPEGDGAPERRQDERREVRVPLLYHVEDGIEERVSATLDISLSGLKFTSRRKLANDDRVRMRLLVPGELRPVMLHGVVRWVGTGDEAEQYDIGVRFDPAAAPLPEALSRLVSA